MMVAVKIRVRRASSGESRNPRLAHLQESLRSSLWFLPSMAVAATAAVAWGMVALDRRLDGSPSWLAFNGGPTSAQQILTTIATSMMTFTGLVFTLTIVVLQLASSQFSPRVLRTFLRDRSSQVALAVFTSTFVFALFVLGQVRTGTVGPVFVPGLSVTLSFALVVVSLTTFVYFVNHIAQSIRVVNIIESLAAETRHSLVEVYGAESDSPLPDTVDMPELGTPDRLIAMEGGGGVLCGLDIAGLVELARRHDCVLRLLPDIGDYVAGGAALFEVHGGRGNLPEGEVRRQIDVSRERTMRQDPAYGFRQLVDIAEKALSPSLNDPTTAVQALDRLHDLMRRVAVLPQPSGVYCDDDGQVRFVRKVISWSGFVTLAFEEIRRYGGSSIQVHRRLRASLEELLDLVPDDRRGPLERQLRLLKRTAAEAFPTAEERRLAAESDEAGIGSVEEPAKPASITGRR